MSFIQAGPQLGNQYAGDRVLRSYLKRVLPAAVRADIEPDLDRFGELAGGPLYQLSLRYRAEVPEHIAYDAWGKRIDEVRVNTAWREYARVAAREGLVATGYERRHGAYSRIHQFAKVYLFDRSSQTYTCPLAMTDGCARTLERVARPELRDRVLGHLLARDPEQAWTAGQWMTERAGGSDVGLSETVARQTPEGWRLYGTKWFTSAVTSQVALTLARPEGNGPGGRGLALFFVNVRDENGVCEGIEVNRLKEKLGTRQVPTAELTLDGVVAEPLTELHDGVRNMASMLNLTRTWNAVCSTAYLRRGLALARDYAGRRVAFGAPLAEKPLHLETLADVAAEHEAGFLLAFEAVRLLGQEELGEIDSSAAATLRLLQPIAKLTTARQAVAGASEILESFGGAGYVEDTGLPELLRDAQVLPIWEGTTNVLSLESLRAARRADALEPFLADLKLRAGAAEDSDLREAGAVALEAAASVRQWWDAAETLGPGGVEAGARRFALTLGRAYALALLVEQAQWARANEGCDRSAEAARRFARATINRLDTPVSDAHATRSLAMDEFAKAAVPGST